MGRGKRGDSGVQGGEALRNSFVLLIPHIPSPDLACSPASAWLCPAEKAGPHTALVLHPYLSQECSCP